MPADLPDRLYEAAFIPELWPSVCEEIARVAGAYSAAIMTVDTQSNYRWVCSPHIQEAMANFATNARKYHNVRPERQLKSGRFSFMRDIDLMTPEEIEHDPIYEAFMRPIGLGWSAGDVVVEPSGHQLIVDLIRETKAGPFEASAIDAMNRLKPDISRASWFASRLAFQEARNSVETLGLVGMPAAVMGDTGTLIDANRLFEDLDPQVSVGAGNRVRIPGGAAEALLDRALATLHGLDVPMVQSIPVPARKDGETPLILNVIPIRKRSRDIFNRSSAILLVTKVGVNGTLDLQVLRGLFDLTPAEARIAWEIGSGNTVELAAQINGISKETVRTYLKRIMQKTGVRTQAQLVLLLSGLPLR